MSYSNRAWWSQARWQVLLFIVIATPFAVTEWDGVIARALFFDPASGKWLAAGSFWINDVIHTGGRWAIRVLVAVLLVSWLISHRASTWRAWQRPLGYTCLAMVLSIALVGVLKTLTNVDCPWDLTAFGGRFPYVHLFGDRPNELPTGHCFPAAHASSGYAVLACYFALRERSMLAARCMLILGITLGLVFGVAQQARGAHFISHDLWSAFLVWMTAQTMYVHAFNAQLWPALARSEARGQRGDERAACTD